jgi:hypothetical protein
MMSSQFHWNWRGGKLHFHNLGGQESKKRNPKMEWGLGKYVSWSAVQQKKAPKTPNPTIAVPGGLGKQNLTNPGISFLCDSHLSLTRRQRFTLKSKQLTA